MKSITKADLIKHFPALRKSSDGAVEDVLKSGRYQAFSRDMQIY